MKTVSIVACICCAVASSTLAGRVPGDSLTNSKGPTLGFNVLGDVLNWEHSLAPQCKSPRVVNTEIVGDTNKLSFGSVMQWTEKWTVDRCGKKVFYTISFNYRRAMGHYKIQAPAN